MDNELNNNIGGGTGNAGRKSRTCYYPLNSNAFQGFFINMVRNLVSDQYRGAEISVEPATGMWRVVWYCMHPGTGRLERVRKTFDLNRIKDLKKRRLKAEVWVELINHALANGWNTFIDQPLAEMAIVPASQPVVTVADAIDKALKQRVLGKAERTQSTYRSFVQCFKEWMGESELLQLSIEAFTADMFQDYLFYKADLGHGNRNLNDHLNFFKTTFDQVRKNKQLTLNPLTDMAYLPEYGSTLFAPLTAEEIKKIVPALMAHNPRLYVFTKFIPYEFIRPRHIARLKARDINYAAGTISLHSETTKNKKVTVKQLLPAMRDLLLQMGYDKLPGDYYLFAKNFEPGRELYPRLSITAAEQWRQVVKEGLGIDKKMYALKHTSAQHLINANENFDLKFLQQHMEHHSYSQTEIYLQGKVVKRINPDAKTLDY